MAALSRGRSDGTRATPVGASVTASHAEDGRFRELSETQAAILNALPAHVALLDAHGLVVATNESWRRFGAASGMPPGNGGIGTSYLEACERAEGACAVESRAVAAGIRQVLRGETHEFALEYPCHAPDERRWFRVIVTPVRDDEHGGAVITRVDVTQQRLAEDALRASEARLRAIVESGPECVKTVSVDGRLLDVNPAGLRMLEADDAAEVVGQPVLDLVHPDDRERFADLHRRVSGGASGELQFRIVGRKGAERWVETHATPLRDVDGTIAAVLSVTRDVTERKRRERLEACETKVLEAISAGWRLGAVLETAALGIEEVLGDGQVSVLLLDEDGHVRHAAAPHLPAAYARAIDGAAIGPSAGSCGTAAYRKEPVAVEDIASDPLWSDYRDLALAHGLRACWSTPVIDADGRVLATFAVYHREPHHPRAADQEVIDRAVHLVRLAVQRAQREDALRNSEERLRMASRISRMGGWSVDLTGAEPRLHGSPEVHEIFGLPRDHVADMDREIDRYVPEHRAAMRAALVTCAREGHGFDLQLEVLDVAGRRLWTRTIGEALRDDGGRIVGVQGAFQDISAQKAAEQSLAESQRRFRDLADAMPIIVFTSLPHGEVDFVNLAFARYAGIAEVDLGNVGWLRAVHPDDVKRALSSASESIARGAAHEVQLRLRRAADGAYRWHQVGAVPVRDAAGQIVKWYGSAADIDDVMRLEQDASSLAHGLVTTLESITDAFFTVDRDWRFTYWNAEAERMVGRTRDEVLGKVLWEAFPDARDSIFEQHYRHALEQNVAVTFEGHYAPIDRWLEIRAYPSSEGGLVVYFHDVTDLRAAREAIQESEERFRLLARATNDAIWDWDYVTDALWWNEGFEALFGFSRAEVEPTIDSWYCRIHPDERDELIAGIHRTVADGAESWVREYRFLRKDGSYAYVLDRGHVIRDAAGKAIRMIGGMTDLTERRQAEERLAEQAALLDAAHEAIVVHALDDTIIYWNRGAERTFGWMAAEALGQGNQELLAPEPGAYATARRLLRERGEWQGELTKHTKDGRELTVDVHWTLVRDAAGRPKSVLAIDTDITERKKLEQQFLRAQRMESIGTLAGGIAHDLNNLLAPISMGVELMKTYGLDEKCERILGSMELSARRGIDLVKQVLSFARGIEGVRATIEIEDVARDVESIVERTFPKSLQMTREVCAEPWPVLGDPTQLNQVLLNLCVNARDAMPDGGRLAIAVRNRVFDANYAAMNHGVVAGRYVEVEVADTGCGIPAHLVDRIFEPFFTTKEIGKGTGLGLSTVVGIVRSHGGFVNVASEVGKGTSFRVFLPALEDAVARGVKRGAAGEPLPRGNGELVLIVDDEAPILHITRQTLEAFGYRALTAEDGAHAVGLFALHRGEIAVVLTDIMMPVMDGLALLAALRRIDPDVRVIASSGLDARGNVTRVTHDGVEHFLAKPYSADELLQTLRAILVSTDGPRRADAAAPVHT